ncbi:glyoxalase/bleomycin resistance/extradiol dioxygenase family protein [Muriicola soli]|uniref:Glyoxalase/bleomycin resistance/extradiol dioxygenase family protein n=1 Tax=Muriicola soli TaxID=2507538 RepID=A0A411EBQ5_9FLAO|nr:glyoxalase/bleomycin resistance/extradiol dioxygenase family protein [Muriicola soli]QBA64963.1 glyoxalase/bleomycin resistance/extradiol dioxygenase family protein [Muriicola soli]
MNSAQTSLQIIPVLSSSDIERDLAWYKKHTGFNYAFGDKGYAGLQREKLEFHLQFHRGTDEDPVHGSVIKIFVQEIVPYFEEFVERGTVEKDKLRLNTPWGTHEFGFFDLNNNAVFIVQDI